MTSQVWLFQLWFSWRDLQVGLRWFRDEAGLHVHAALPGVRVQVLRSKSVEIADAVHKHTQPPPRPPVTTGRVTFRRQ